MSKPTFKILDERTVHRRPEDGGDEAVEENPYWAWEELPPHPDPSKGCIRRGLCCRSSPGRFAPGEVEAAAAVKQLEPDSFVRKYLIVDNVGTAEEPVYAFAPVKLDRHGKPAMPTGGLVDGLYRALRGTCVFFRDEGCGIYEARPWECREYICTNAPEDNPSHEDVAEKWRDVS